MMTKRRILSMLLACLLVVSMSITAFASEDIELTEAELLAQIANHTATVTHEVRSLDSYTQEEIAQSPDLQQIFNELNALQPYSINTEYAYGKLYTTTVVTDGGQTVVYRSSPRVRFSVVDVGTAGSADIYSTFEVIESVNVDGNLDSGWHNAIRYKNITGAMGCGTNTAFTDEVVLSGNSSGLMGVNIEGIIELIVNSSGLTTASQILSVLGNITYSGGMESNRNISSQYVRAVGAKMDTAELFSNDHDLTVQSSMSTVDSSGTANQSANAAVEWEYDVYYFVGSVSPAYSNETLSCDVTYLTNVK